ncbi:hypothetical protein AOLI_G00306400 [Acnodon oligacanthus]
MTVPSYSEQDLPCLMDRFSQACRDFAPTISLQKTNNVLGQDVGTPPVITIDDYELEVVHQFTYLSSTISDNLSLDAEINKRIGKGHNNPSTTDRSHLGKPHADRSNEDGSAQCLHNNSSDPETGKTL